MSLRPQRTPAAIGECDAERAGLSVPVPYRLRQRPTHGGLPIPYLVAILDKEGHPSAAGRPDFRIADPVRVARCMQQRRCGLCGQTLERTMVFIGGPGLREQRLCCEPPAHEECARYALVACPYLAGRKARRMDTDTKERLDMPKMEGTYEHVEQGGAVLLLWTDHYRPVLREETGVWYYHCAPWVKVEEVRG